MHSSVVLYTAGIDSYILLKYIRKLVDPKTVPIYFNLQHKYSEEEEKLVRKNESDCEVDCITSFRDLFVCHFHDVNLALFSPLVFDTNCSLRRKPSFDLCRLRR